MESDMESDMKLTQRIGQKAYYFSYHIAHPYLTQILVKFLLCSYLRQNLFSCVYTVISARSAV
jgi:hypothetical protein